jgi:hypothetical protein
MERGRNHCAGGFDGEACLADAARANQRHQSAIRVSQQACDVGEFRLSPDESARLRWEIVHGHARIAQEIYGTVF